MTVTVTVTVNVTVTVTVTVSDQKKKKISIKGALARSTYISSMSKCNDGVLSLYVSLIFPFILVCLISSEYIMISHDEACFVFFVC